MHIEFFVLELSSTIWYRNASSTSKPSEVMVAYANESSKDRFAGDPTNVVNDSLGTLYGSS